MQQPPEVQLLKVAPATAFPNQQFNYTFFVTNTGIVTAAGLVLSDTIPTGATFIEAPGATLVGN
ncbi:MAG: DUF11 domain-containing protein, partial [Gammaproteobacteria bacterium]|nr:DUF11 domain-containing protein [Gammaproteobacteria bacterium]